LSGAGLRRAIPPNNDGNVADAEIGGWVVLADDAALN
jgi:hypothetical protein